MVSIGPQTAQHVKGRWDPVAEDQTPSGFAPISQDSKRLIMDSHIQGRKTLVCVMHNKEKNPS